jgi:hypothetical protein
MKMFDTAKDMFWLGCLLYRLLYLKYPFDNTTNYEDVMKRIEEGNKINFSSHPKYSPILNEIISTLLSFVYSFI